MDSLVAHGTPSRERGHRREGSYHYIPISRPRTKPLRAKYKEKRKNVDAASEFKKEQVRTHRVACYCIGEGFDEVALNAHFQAFKSKESVQMRDAIHLRYALGSEQLEEGLQVEGMFPQYEKKQTATGDIFVFMFGVVCFWGMNEDLEDVLVSTLEEFVKGPVDEFEVDDLVFSYDPELVDSDMSSERVNENDVRVIKKESNMCYVRIMHDHIRMQTESVYVKLAVSHGLAQSTKLSVFESQVEDLINQNRELPVELAQNGFIQLSRLEISKRIGHIAVQTNQVNLHSDILDTPSFLWEHDELLAEYKKSRDYMDVEQRVKVLNHRLTVLKDMFEMLNSEQTTRHEVKLEWIIIVLVLLEGIFDLIPILVNFGLYMYDIFGPDTAS